MRLSSSPPPRSTRHPTRAAAAPSISGRPNRRSRRQDVSVTVLSSSVSRMHGRKVCAVEGRERPCLGAAIGTFVRCHSPTSQPPRRSTTEMVAADVAAGARRSGKAGGQRVSRDHVRRRPVQRLTPARHRRGCPASATLTCAGTAPAAERNRPRRPGTCRPGRCPAPPTDATRRACPSCEPTHESERPANRGAYRTQWPTTAPATTPSTCGSRCRGHCPHAGDRLQ